MSAEYAISVDPARDLVRIRMRGFFTRAEIEDFLVARREAHGRLVCAPNMHLTLNDLREMKIQSQDMVEAFRDMLAAPAYRSRRLAFVVTQTLARSQLMRALDKRQARCFADIESAERWLFSASEDSIAA